MKAVPSVLEGLCRERTVKKLAVCLRWLPLWLPLWLLAWPCHATPSEILVPKAVKAKVRFWYDVFTSYEQDIYLIHDREYPEVIVDFIDFKMMAKTGTAIPPAQRSRYVKKLVKRYNNQLSTRSGAQRLLATKGRLSKPHSKVYRAYTRKALYRNRLASGKAKVRAQRGMADEFRRAASRAYVYLPYMEAIFRKEGLPTSLTRIAFIESMFQIDAVSKVGASGVWQIMPATAREHITVDGRIDERNSPLKATVAAARTLKHNYDLLGSWPLAITAYNHGPYGIRRATRQLGTKQIGAIIANYRSRTFGFASKNFYAEYLAARIAYRNLYSKRKLRPNPMGIATVKLARPLSLTQVSGHARISLATIKQYNRCLLPRGLRYYRYRPLPANFVLNIPLAVLPKSGNIFRTAL